MICPGQDSRYWGPGAIFEAACPQCGNSLEFFKDESSRRCKNCGFKAMNPRLDFGCATSCRFAEQCLGDLPPELLAKREDLLKDRVALEMKKYFGRDFKRIGHAVHVAQLAERIVKGESGDLAVVLLAAYLHDIGIHQAERKHKSTAGRYQELEGPPIAREILSRTGAREALAEEVCDIVGHHHHPRPEETLNFKCLYDADLIVNMKDIVNGRPLTEERLNRWIEKKLFTPTGRRVAREVFGLARA